jgi:hypothetical protein
MNSSGARARRWRGAIELPFGLSLSKPIPSLLGRREGEAFDKLRPNGLSVTCGPSDA